MAYRTKHPCAYLGCPKTTNARYCEEHAGKRPPRESSRRKGYDSRWERYRKVFLREHPLCVRCLAKGIMTPATDVDHIVPVDGPDDPLFWEPTNHQALDHSCHSVKTMTEDRPRRIL